MTEQIQTVSLTPAGEKWARENTGSIVAKVALDGSGGWPSAFRDTAVRACNAAALEGR